ncbi:MAG: sensor histidine kinase [Anaerolineales bacterium]|nr:sensor histidine kinase [Anaerolineales bacterium]
MDSLRALFDLNRQIFQFLYGLVFFVLGLAIAVQTRSYSRLELARSLGWLAAFGLLHGSYEWAELFAPVQEAYLSERGIFSLHLIHLALLCLSFVALFEFGVALLRPLGRGQWLHNLSVVILGAYLLVIAWPLPLWLPDPHTWHRGAEALARYGIAFPAGLLAAYGLREQTFLHIAPLNVPRIIRTLRVAGVALALYALAGGLIPPRVPFFPGSWLNSESFERALGVPPLVITSIIGLVLAVAVIRALEVFDLETRRQIEQMEQQQILAAERDRIARDLHDGAIQTVYTAGLLVESAYTLTPPDSPAASRLEKAMLVLNDAIAALRRNLGQLRPARSSESLAEALEHLAADPRFRSMVDVQLQVDLPPTAALAPARTDHVLAVVAEALSNVVRHARARHVLISAARRDGHLTLTVQDDGIGAGPAPSAGYGLRNMRDRARLLGGELQVAGSAGKGTRVQLSLPWDEAH